VIASRVRTWVRWFVRMAMLGLAAREGSAQVRPDSTKRDSVAAAVPDSAAADSVMRARILARTDSVQKAILADTLKAPMARFEAPTGGEVTERLRFTGNAILATGALNLADLLDRVPGVTTMRSGWIPGLHAASFNGDPGRIRIFLDGIEMDGIEPRNGGALDLTDIQLWTLDEVVIERAPGEVRVWLRTSTVIKTTPYTRVDIFTGDLNTNGFRGLFARRWRNGFLLQLGGQQVATQTGRVSAFGAPAGGTTSQRLRGDGTIQGFMARTGWARGRLSVDAFASSVSRDRDAHTPRPDFDSLPGFKGGRREGYLRFGFGDTTRGFWTQALTGALRTRQEGDSAAAAVSTSPPTDSTAVAAPLDTIRSQTQHLIAVGYRGARWSVSVANRARPINGALRHAPVVRAGATVWKVEVGGYSERNGRDSTDRTDLFARVRPLSWLTLTAGRSSRAPDDTTGRPETSTLRTEAAVRLRTVWIGGGVLRDAARMYANPVLIGAPVATLTSRASQGLLISAHGRLYKDVHLDVQALRWDDAQYSRPKTQLRVELALLSEWRRRFPKGEFSINARLLYDRRGGVPFFYGVANGEAIVRITEPAQVATGLLELRIQRATLFYQYRNLTGGQYEQIRGITMPPAVQMYGVRWEFWN
jgi:hypothetical protein